MLFNRNPVEVGESIQPPDGELIKQTPSLWNASLDDAIRFGGELTRQALQACDITGDRRYITVDTKIHMLMPGMLPGIPGWHTDGVPRHRDGSPEAGGKPLLDLQQLIESYGEGPRFHLLVTGKHCSTEFFTEEVDLNLPSTARLYAEMTREVDKLVAGDLKPTLTAPDSTWVDWDWWNIHRAVPANAAGWRFLIRVTESNFLIPQTDIRKVIRLHNPVYIPLDYGW